mmetsp:Transcript_36426/g.96392  ORF Transcript_36426/g.96392 Transcript_36426/m.96392 type:complete len:219 (+) Transcript_36426:1883-2539(+)
MLILVWFPKKYLSKVSSCSVALMRMRRRSDRRASRSRMKIMLKSASLSRSCTSSKMTCVMPFSSVSESNLLRKTPKVRNTNFAFGALEPKGTWKPTSAPMCWQRSCAMRSASVVAAILRGCITSILASGQESRMSCGTCVDFPQPVSPLRSTTWLRCTVWMTSSRRTKAGRASRFSPRPLYRGCNLLASSVVSMTSTDIGILPWSSSSSAAAPPGHCT